MQITFVDTNKNLCNKVSLALTNLGVIKGYVERPFGVVVSASNPQFTFGGGWDACIARWFPKECAEARKNKGVNQRIGNVIFTVTVDGNYKATEELVRNAIRFALGSVRDDETLVVTGLGTGIGGLSEDKFVDIFVEETK